MKIFRILILSILALSFLPVFAAAQTAAADLKPAHANVLKKWLAAKNGWRLALEKDYGKDKLDFMRRNEGRILRPFYVAKDFNGDRKEDFAVILINNHKMFAVAVFNAPFTTKAIQQPAFFTDKIEAGDIAYYNQNSNLLLIGPYASDSGFMLKPKGKTYKVEYPDFDN